MKKGVGAVAVALAVLLLALAVWLQGSAAEDAPAPPTIETAPDTPAPPVQVQPVPQETPPPKKNFTRPGFISVNSTPTLKSADFPGGEPALQELGGLLLEETLDACLVEHLADGGSFMAFVQFQLDDRGLRQLDIMPIKVRDGVSVPDPELELDPQVSTCIDNLLWTLDVPPVPGILGHGFMFRLSGPE